MIPQRAWRLDLSAAVLLLAGLAAALAGFGAGPAGPPRETYPPPPGPGNLLGEPGALVSGLLLEALGAAVYPWLATWFVLVVWLLLRRDGWAWSRRLLGWLVLVAATAVLAERCETGWAGAPTTGPGGAVG